MKIIDFTEEWIQSASLLAMENYEEERKNTFSLPGSVIIPRLDSLAHSGLGVAAVDGEKLLGFLGAYGPFEPVFCTQAVRGVFSPLHAHGSVKHNRIKIYQHMYQAAAEKWTDAGATSHAVTLYSHDSDANKAFFLYGFGMRCMDLIRLTAKPVCEKAQDCTFYELPLSRHCEIHDLRKALSDHLSQSPCFMADTPEAFESWLHSRELDPPRVFAAEKNGHIAAYIEVKAEGENFAVSEPGTLNICGAYCVPHHRSENVVQSLLDYLVSVLKTEGVLRLGVDCESFNPTALYFWTKYFDVYSHSLVRRIDENAVKSQSGSFVLH